MIVGKLDFSAAMEEEDLNSVLLEELNTGILFESVDKCFRTTKYL